MFRYFDHEIYTLVLSPLNEYILPRAAAINLSLTRDGVIYFMCGRKLTLHNFRVQLEYNLIYLCLDCTYTCRVYTGIVSNQETWKNG